ncbi:hypothetical protein CALCODRAFT_513396 [Calocera cornea HHB12733]|uniref:Uncharacterized protein n=1 Tax=Calocera cornea HHB12733 TaxID=1353952 RepID=A0A165C5B3_9BASI|nr:hypothetical protein CALCODRAFT_513396 [Calocera cornea HHB12733]
MSEDDDDNDEPPLVWFNMAFPLNEAIQRRALQSMVTSVTAETVHMAPDPMDQGDAQGTSDCRGGDGSLGELGVAARDWSGVGKKGGSSFVNNVAAATSHAHAGNRAPTGIVNDVAPPRLDRPMTSAAQTRPSTRSISTAPKPDSDDDESRMVVDPPPFKPAKKPQTGLSMPFGANLRFGPPIPVSDEEDVPVRPTRAPSKRLGANLRFGPPIPGSDKEDVHVASSSSKPAVPSKRAQRQGSDESADRQSEARRKKIKAAADAMPTTHPDERGVSGGVGASWRGGRCHVVDRGPF